MTYLADLPPNRPGFAGMLGQAESILTEAGIAVPAEGSGQVLNVRYDAISMPALRCRNTSGAGPGTIRPWTGAPRDENGKFSGVDTIITANLRVGIADECAAGRVLELGLSGFRERLADGQHGRPITVGRPISEHNDFGLSAYHEAYTSMTMVAHVLGGTAVSHDIIVEDQDGARYSMFMQVYEAALPVHRKPAYLLGSTCLLALGRKARSPSATPAA